MPIVYRIQDSVGRGPYRPGVSLRWAGLLHQLRNRTFMEEFPWLSFKLRGTEDSFGCAFRTLKQLRAWFNEDERQRLAKLGYVIVRMEVDEILAESAHQLVFWRSKPLRRDVQIIDWEEVTA